jgi:hypothetical protein
MMKKFIQFELGLLRERLAEVPVDLRQIRKRPYRSVTGLLILAFLMWFIYRGPIILDLQHWVRYGTFPRR